MPGEMHWIPEVQADIGFVVSYHNTEPEPMEGRGPVSFFC